MSQMVTGAMTLDMHTTTKFYRPVGAPVPAGGAKKMSAQTVVLAEIGSGSVQMAYRVIDDTDAPGAWNLVGGTITATGQHALGEIDISATTAGKMLVQAGVAYWGSAAQMELQTAIQFYQ